MSILSRWILMSVVLVTACGATPERGADIRTAPLVEASPARLPQGVLVGETTATSFLVQARVLGQDVMVDVATAPNFKGSKTLSAIPSAERDHIIRVAFDGLRSNTVYYYRVRSNGEGGPQVSAIGRVKTLPAPDALEPISLAVTGCYNFHLFHFGRHGRRKDRHLGYPALDAIRKLSVDHVVFTGDSVYYDSPPKTRALTRDDMRAKWHEQFTQARFRALFRGVGTYWQKDDHDYRFNDADRTGKVHSAPDDALGQSEFRVQAPILPEEETGPLWRTHRMGGLLQVWFLESRDHRSPNLMTDGPKKTLWGTEQLKWLKQTLAQSDAPFKLVVSPTPLVGPDDRKKMDNHTHAFRHEGQAFLSWLKQTFAPGEVILLNGDRHWRYHSIDPTGIDELSCGSICNANARAARKPRDPKGTDPEGLIQQPYATKRRTGGFLTITAKPAGEDAVLILRFHDVWGKVEYELIKRRPLKLSGGPAR